MALDKKVFLTRLSSAIVFAILMLSGLLWNYWAFIGLFFLIQLVCLREFASMVEKISNTTFSGMEKFNFFLIGCVTFVLVSCLPLNACFPFPFLNFPGWLFYIIGIWLGLVMVFFVFRKNKFGLHLLSGIGYISLSFGLLVQLRYQSAALPLMLILMIWMNDSLAYITGSFFGKRKLAPSISPKKTIEGTLGGILFTMLLAVLGYFFLEKFHWIDWIMMASIASIMGTVGDLAESQLKRLANVKDSGNLMPGHGGALDRFDSLLIAAPCAFLYALLRMNCVEINFFP